MLYANDVTNDSWEEMDHSYLLRTQMEQPVSDHKRNGWEISDFIAVNNKLSCRIGQVVTQLRQIKRCVDC